MGLGVDVGIDAQRDRRDLADRGGHAGDRVELGLALDVEHQDAGLQPGPDLLVGLAHAGEHGLVRRTAGQADAVQLAGRDDVEPAAVLGHHLEDAQVRVGLHRVAHQGVDLGVRGLERFERPQDRRLAVDVQRRAEPLGQLGRRHVLAVQLSVAVVEGFHGSSGSVRG